MQAHLELGEADEQLHEPAAVHYMAPAHAIQSLTACPATQHSMLKHCIWECESS